MASGPNCRGTPSCIQLEHRSPTFEPTLATRQLPQHCLAPWVGRGRIDATPGEMLHDSAAESSGSRELLREEANPLIGWQMDMPRRSFWRSVALAGIVLLCLGSVKLLPRKGGDNGQSLVARHMDLTTLDGTGHDHRDPVPDVFCFVVMGLPDLERPLIISQQTKGKGIFQCPAHAVFGKGNTPPVTHALPTLNFGVARGGQWGTALNTPIFKEIWQKAGCGLPIGGMSHQSVGFDNSLRHYQLVIFHLIRWHDRQRFLSISGMDREPVAPSMAPAYVLRLQSCLQRVGAQSVTAFPAILWEKGCQPRLTTSCGAYNVAYHPRSAVR
eukprot:Skav224337  [mRNA]  locus=scaffold1353:290785:297101:- [translate_table: standard]